MLLYGLFFELTMPHGLLPWLALGTAVLLSWLVSFSWNFLINLSAFWTPNAQGIGRFGFLIALFLSGFLMPIRFFPPWLVRLAYLTPFPHMLNSVVEIYLGILQGSDLLLVLLMQLLWAGVLIAAGQLVLRMAVRRLVILGG
jgi:ABC-2 type transport system permease protein